MTDPTLPALHDVDETRIDALMPDGATGPLASSVSGHPSTPWSQIGRSVAQGLHALFSAGIYAAFIITFIFQVARVDGRSMSPTLEDHDRLIVNKFVYLFNDPQPGDIVMLRYPADPDTMFVKRVIARENDTVQIADGLVSINGVPLHDTYVPAEFRSHDNLTPTTLESGYYFVLGDHRNQSSDSRTWGPVPKKYIVGRVHFRWWPLSGARLF
jgi:signal peptidase I